MRRGGGCRCWCAPPRITTTARRRSTACCPSCASFPPRGEQRGQEERWPAGLQANWGQADVLPGASRGAVLGEEGPWRLVHTQGRVRRRRGGAGGCAARIPRRGGAGDRRRFSRIDAMPPAQPKDGPCLGRGG